MLCRMDIGRSKHVAQELWVLHRVFVLLCFLMNLGVGRRLLEGLGVGLILT